MSVFRGSSLTIEIFGASHAESIGVTVTGLPAGESVDTNALRAFMRRRSPGGRLSSSRSEADEPVFLAGLKDGVTDGGVLRAVIYNTDARPSDYDALRSVPRPGHADYTAWIKYGRDFDMSGGGPFSGRMTAAMCIIGGICLQILEKRGVSVSSRIVSVGGKDSGFEAEIENARADGDSVGGIVECTVTGFPAGFGGELYDGLEGLISQLVFAIPAVKGIEFGAGFKAAGMRGSECNDPFTVENGRIVTVGNDHGGILGGISSGMPIVFRAAIKPTPSIAKEQDSVDIDTLRPVKLTVSGRHDPCIVPRALPVIESAAAIALCDLLFAEHGDGLAELRYRLDRLDADVVGLFDRRMKLCGMIAEYKMKNGLPTYDGRRESEKLRDIRLLAGEDTADAAAELYREIFRLSREYQDKMREKE